MKKLLAGILLVVAIAYVICPIDFMPGIVIDDLIVGLLGGGSSIKLMASNA